MRLRPYIAALDYETLAAWVTDERLHAMWSARRFPYPLTRQGLDEALERMAASMKNAAFVAEDDNGAMVGFFCYSLSEQDNEGVLKFVIVSPEHRGRGYGRELVTLAARYAFEITKADSVRLAVFEENPAAKRCYLGAGFRERSVTENAFPFRGECWSRCSMVLRRCGSEQAKAQE